MRKNMLATSPVGNSSLAYKYGVNIKENASIGHMGLNPNLNIEDEYIENLLKQIHFMNMEIKLIKEKQSKSEGNALWGVINRTNEPMVSNIVQSSQKYQQMKKEIDRSIGRLERDISGLQNNQGALLNEIVFLEAKKEETEAKQAVWNHDCSSKCAILNQKINSSSMKLKGIREDLDRQMKKNAELTEAYDKIVNDDLREKARVQKESLQINNDQTIEQMMERDKIAEIEEMKLKIKNLREIFEQNMEYLRAQEEQKALKLKQAQVEKQIAGANFELMQLSESIKMADLEREKEVRERKRLTEDFEQNKTMLQEILFMNLSRKQKEAMARKKQSPEIKKAEEQTAKLQKSLEETKRKLIKSEEASNQLQNQIEAHQRELDKVKERQKILKDKHLLLSQSNQQREAQLVAIRNEIRILEDSYERVLHEETNTSLDLFELDKQLQFLRGRKDLLQQNMELKDVVNGVKVEDLQRVVQKNNDLNSTVATLMTKWDEIKSFSRI